MHQVQLGAIDYTILMVYFVFVLGIGWFLRRSVRSSEDFFLSGRSIPTWIAGLAFLSANLGAQEVIGMAASGAKYGMTTSHFYWVGAIQSGDVPPTRPGPALQPAPRVESRGRSRGRHPLHEVSTPHVVTIESRGSTTAPATGKPDQRLLRAGGRGGRSA